MIYLTIAPETGVVQPTIRPTERAKKRSVAIILRSFKLFRFGMIKKLIIARTI